MESEADFDTIIDLSHLELVQPAHVLFDTTLVDGPDLLQKDHGIAIQAFHILNSAVGGLITLLPHTGGDGSHDQRRAKEIAGIVLQQQYRPCATLFGTDKRVKICKIDIAAAIAVIFAYHPDGRA